MANFKKLAQKSDPVAPHRTDRDTRPFQPHLPDVGLEETQHVQQL